MSTLKMKIRIIVVLFMVGLIVLSVVAQGETDEILNYYQKRANEVFNSRNPIISGLQFSFEATTYREVYDNNYNIIIVDSTIARYFYSFGELDSIITEVPAEKKIDSVDINYLNIFDGTYLYNFYPNDTGGQELAIGYDSYDFDTTVPVGIAIINRERYFLTRLYLHLMNDKKIERASKIIKFTVVEGFVFPDSISEIKSKSSIFSTEYYRTETSISDIQIKR